MLQAIRITKCCNLAQCAPLDPHLPRYDIAPEVFHSDNVDIRVLRRCSEAQAHSFLCCSRAFRQNGLTFWSRAMKSRELDCSQAMTSTFEVSKCPRCSTGPPRVDGLSSHGALPQCSPRAPHERRSSLCLPSSLGDAGKKAKSGSNMV